MKKLVKILKNKKKTIVYSKNLIYYTCGSNLFIINAMKATIIGKRNKYIIKSNIGGISAPITVDAAINMIMVMTGPKMATNMYIMVNEFNF